MSVGWEMLSTMRSILGIESATKHEVSKFAYYVNRDSKSKVPNKKLKFIALQNF